MIVGLVILHAGVDTSFESTCIASTRTRLHVKRTVSLRPLLSKIGDCISGFADQKRAVLYFSSTYVLIRTRKHIITSFMGVIV